ncbi:MAG TPA: hypothetical protein P5084_02360 [Paludibacter sp.]|nr:hypothetical protein [Paludibacter sp.]
MNLKTENIKEFLINDDFINYVIHPTLKLQLHWEIFFKNNPELIGFADQARKILCEEGDIFELHEWETNDVKNRIIDQCGISLLN